MWRGYVERTDADELAAAITGGMLAGAWLDGSLIGCLRLRVIDDQTAELGIRAASGQGVLHAWYSRRGSEVVSTEDFAVVLPIAKDLLAVPCDFPVFWKTL